MSEIIKIDSRTLKNYFNDFTREKTKFKNTTYNGFKSSYLNTCGDSYVRKMANILNPLYTDINTGYDNINTWWEKYIKEAEATESSITDNNILGVSEGLIRSALGRLPKLQNFILNNVTFSSSNSVTGGLYNSKNNIFQNLSNVFGLAMLTVDGIANNITSSITNARSKALDWWNNEAVPVIRNGALMYDESVKVCEETQMVANAPVAGTVSNVGLSLVEGVLNFGEAMMDSIVSIGSLSAQATMFQQENELRLAGIDTGLDLDEFNRNLQEGTQAFVAEEKVTNAFNNFYETNEMGQYIKENSLAFDTVRSIGNGVGYMAGTTALSLFTFGGSAVGIAATAATAGVGKGAQEAWKNGATYNEGLTYGAATGAWEGLQYYVGAKLIGQSNIFGREGSKLFIEGSRRRVMESTARVVMDGIDSGAEGLVQPFLQSLYVDGYYDEDGNYIDFAGNKDFTDMWYQIFMDNGGWTNVATQAAMGAVGSTIGEALDLGKYFKNEKGADVVSETLDDVKDQLAKGKLKVNGKNMEIPDVLKNRFGDLIKDNEIDLDNLSGKEGYDKLSEVFFRMKGALQLLSEDVPDNMRSEYYSLMQSVTETEMGGRILSQKGDYDVASSILGKRLENMLEGFTEMKQRIDKGVHLKFGGKNLEVPEILQNKLGDLIKDNEINIDNISAKEGYDKLSEVFFRIKGALQLLSDDVPDNLKDEYDSFMRNVTAVEKGGRISSKSGDYVQASRTLGARLGDMLDRFTELQQRIDNGIHLRFNGKNLEVPEILRDRFGDLIKDNEIDLDNLSGKEGFDSLSKIFSRTKGALEGLRDYIPEGNLNEYKEFMQYVEQGDRLSRINVNNGDYTKAIKNLEGRLGEMLGYLESGKLVNSKDKLTDAFDNLDVNTGNINAKRNVDIIDINAPSAETDVKKIITAYNLNVYEMINSVDYAWSEFCTLQDYLKRPELRFTLTPEFEEFIKSYPLSYKERSNLIGIRNRAFNLIHEAFNNDEDVGEEFVKMFIDTTAPKMKTDFENISKQASFLASSQELYKDMVDYLDEFGYSSYKGYLDSLVDDDIKNFKPLPLHMKDFYEFSIDKDTSVKEMGEYFGDGGEELNSLLTQGMSLKKAIAKLNENGQHEAARRAEWFAQNTVEGRFLSGLTNKQIDWLETYSNEGYEPINKALRGMAAKPAGFDEAVREIDLALNQFKLDKDMVMYRGVGLDALTNDSAMASVLENVDTKDPNQLFAALKSLEGHSICDQAYMSASPGFNTSFAGISDYPIVYKIYTPSGTCGAYINQLSARYNVENEFLYARGIPLDIKKVNPPTADEKGNFKIVVECVIEKRGFEYE